MQDHNSDTRGKSSKSMQDHRSNKTAKIKQRHSNKIMQNSQKSSKTNSIQNKVSSPPRRITPGPENHKNRAKRSRVKTRLCPRQTHHSQTSATTSKVYEIKDGKITASHRDSNAGEGRQKSEKSSKSKSSKNEIPSSPDQSPPRQTSATTRKTTKSKAIKRIRAMPWPPKQQKSRKIKSCLNEIPSSAHASPPQTKTTMKETTEAKTAKESRKRAPSQG